MNCPFNTTRLLKSEQLNQDFCLFFTAWPGLSLGKQPSRTSCPSWLVTIHLELITCQSSVMKYSRQTQKDIKLYWIFIFFFAVWSFPPTAVASVLNDWPQHLEAFIILFFYFFAIIIVLNLNLLNCTSVKDVGISESKAFSGGLS